MQIKISNEEIADLIKKDESVSFEYKGTLNDDIKGRLSTYFAAFANTEGGLFVIGINNLKETIGYTLKERERDQISEQAKICRPQVDIDIEERKYDGQKIVLIYVPKSKYKIHIDNKKRFPTRVGPTLDYLDITGLIPLVRERLGLDYKTTKPEFMWESPSLGEVKTKAKSEEIELCLKAIEGATKEARLEGLKELELLIYKRDISDELKVFDLLEELLNDKDGNIQRKVFDILRLIHRVQNDEESRKKLSDKYSTHILNLAEIKSIPEVHSDAIELLIEMDDKRVIEKIIKIILSESDELYNRVKSNSGLRSLSDENKLGFKYKLLEELNNPEQKENIKKRIIDVLYDIRSS
ncbi:hypothetical protein METP3_03562 [Methanosarcinales archaeon]|nr:hypothetical protein METP3_03562 [Methanosarcinales archaeon]